MSRRVVRNPAATHEPIIIRNVVNGTSYQVQLRARNANGAGPASVAVEGVPRPMPSAPAVAAVAEGDRTLTVTFDAPAYDGGSPVVNYRYSLDGGATWTTRVPAWVGSPLVIRGLVNGRDYDLRLRAVNADLPGYPSGTVTARPRTTPSSPIITGIVAGRHRLVVYDIPPGSNGGSLIKTYEYSTDNGVTWQPRSQVLTFSPLVITGLTNGVTYSVRIRAVNGVGAGSPSNMRTGRPHI